MPDPLMRFNPGDPASKALNATFLNNIIDRLNTKLRRPSPSVLPDSPVGTVEVMVMNNTSSDFPERSILNPFQPSLSITEPSDKLAFQKRPVLDVCPPTDSTDIPVIACEPIPKNGGIGRAIIAGVAICTVDVRDSMHQFANPTPFDSTKMTSSDFGQVRIIWKAPGFGYKDALVYLMQSPELMTPNRVEIPIAYCNQNEELDYYKICLEGYFKVVRCDQSSSSSSGSGSGWGGWGSMG